PLPATLLFDYPTLETLTGYLVAQLLPLDTPAPPAAGLDFKMAAQSTPPAAESGEELDELSNDELALLLAKELESIKQRKSR
ncbi:MAG: acyl carrier protein, partial [Chloroflexi bacterium]|nr:acyl carrier protein [Chloroflexota bacterium]MCI0578303.1 acyl carrier protein [Chloroflexota bacterium]MCI0643467.1 acyl carrier protein [Chloroflexota bacterium]MCI0732043.1 acyl carrier protein [Chloroflexota bacterium]